MSERQSRRPQPGDTVTVGDQRFAVIDFDGATYLLESERGTRCRAGVRVVKITLVEKAA